MGRIAFGEWKDSEATNKVLFAIVGVMFILMAWIFTTFGQLTGWENEASVALIFLVIGFIASGIMVADQLLEKNPYFGFGGLGSSYNRLFIALFIGLTLGYLMIAQGFSLAQLSLGMDGAEWALEVIYKVFASVTFEEVLFRGAMFFTIIKLLEGSRLGHWKAFAISAVVTSAVFSLFHFVSYGANPDLMISAFVFSLIAILGNYMAGSLAFGLGLHYVINFMFVLAIVPNPLVFIVGLGLMGIIVVYFIRKRKKKRLFRAWSL